MKPSALWKFQLVQNAAAHLLNNIGCLSSTVYTGFQKNLKCCSTWWSLLFKCSLPWAQNTEKTVMLWDKDRGQPLCSGKMEFWTIRLKPFVWGKNSLWEQRLWHELSQELRTITNVTTFCSKCKASFFDPDFSNLDGRCVLTLLNALLGGTQTLWW